MSEESRMKKTIIRIAVCVVVFLASALIIGSIMNQGHNNMTMEMAPAHSAYDHHGKRRCGMQ